MGNSMNIIKEIQFYFSVIFHGKNNIYNNIVII